MVKFYTTTIIVSLLSILLFSSCERGELLNSEADILEVTLVDTTLNIGRPIITNDKVYIPIIITTEVESKLESQILKFNLTQGATISVYDTITHTYISADSISRNFNKPNHPKYRVTSEDRIWTKDYEVSFFDSKFKKTEFNFNDYELFDGKKKYYTFFEKNDSTGGRHLVWDSGNSGFAMTAKTSTPPEDYPTSLTPAGKIGSGVKLVTCSTGNFGAMVGMPIAAGNLFLGRFELANATSKPLEATQMGVATVMDEPKELTLWCKYKAGTEYKTKDGAVVSDMIDYPEVYAVLYEPELDEKGNPIRLNGKNIRTADNIITIATMTQEHVEQIRVADIETDEYKYIRIPFESRKEFDNEKQSKGIYHIALVFSSSAKGNLFEGAVGSTLYVDEVKFVK